LLTAVLSFGHNIIIPSKHSWTLKFSGSSGYVTMALKPKFELSRLISSWGGWQAVLTSLASVSAIGWLINKLITNQYQKQSIKKLQDKVWEISLKKQWLHYLIF